MKKIAMMLAAGFTIGLLAGCGIPEEEHNAMIADIEAKHQAEVDKLKTQLADEESLKKKAEASLRQNRIELDDATERIKDLQQKGAETAKALAAEKASASSFELDLKTTKSQLAAAQDRALEAENNYSTLDVEYQELKRRFEMFQKNLSSLGSSPSSGTSTPPSSGASPSMGNAPKSDAQKAASLLDQMGTL